MATKKYPNGSGTDLVNLDKSKIVIGTKGTVNYHRILQFTRPVYGINSSPTTVNIIAPSAMRYPEPTFLKYIVDKKF